VTTAAKPVIPPAPTPSTPQPAAKAEDDKAGGAGAPKSEIRAAEAVAAAKAEIKPTDLATSPRPELKTTEEQALTIATAATESALAAKPAESPLTLARPATDSGRPWALIALVGIVILSAFAGGVWWKIKTAQIGPFCPAALHRAQRRDQDPVHVEQNALAVDEHRGRGKRRRHTSILVVSG